MSVFDIFNLAMLREVGLVSFLSFYESSFGDNEQNIRFKAFRPAIHLCMLVSLH